MYRVGHKTLSITRQYCNRNIQWSIMDCKLSPDNRFIAYGSFSGKVHLLTIDSNESHPEPVSVFIGHSHGITWLDCKGDFRYIITNRTIKLRDTRHPSRGSELDKAE